MSEVSGYTAVLDRLESSGASLRCQELADMLSRLGFEIRDGKKQGHKVLVHHGLAGFHSSAYTCGHGRNPEIKAVYVNQVKKLLKRYESELLRFLGESP